MTVFKTCLANLKLFNIDTKPTVRWVRQTNLSELGEMTPPSRPLCSSDTPAAIRPSCPVSVLSVNQMRGDSPRLRAFQLSNWVLDVSRFDRTLTIDSELNGRNEFSRSDLKMYSVITRRLGGYRP